MLRGRESQGEEIKRVKENRNGSRGAKTGDGWAEDSPAPCPVTAAWDVHFLFLQQDTRRPLTHPLSSRHPTLGADCIQVQKESRLSPGVGAVAWSPSSPRSV